MVVEWGHGRGWCPHSRNSTGADVCFLPQQYLEVAGVRPGGGSGVLTLVNGISFAAREQVATALLSPSSFSQPAVAATLAGVGVQGPCRAGWERWPLL